MKTFKLSFTSKYSGYSIRQTEMRYSDKVELYSLDTNILLIKDLKKNIFIRNYSLVSKYKYKCVILTEGFIYNKEGILYENI